jgi:hypothetical protein
MPVVTSFSQHSSEHLHETWDNNPRHVIVVSSKDSAYLQLKIDLQRLIRITDLYMHSNFSNRQF